MQAKDLMTKKVITVDPDAPVSKIAKLLLDRRVSAMPVIDATGAIVGIVSEGDIMRRPETGTDRPSSWWLQLVQGPNENAMDYVKSHGIYAKDVMTREVTTVKEDAPLAEIAELLEKRGIKRVPVMREGKLVGIISRADLLRGLAASKQVHPPHTGDHALREAAEAAVEKHAGLGGIFVSITVTNGVARIWGGVELPATKDAIRVAVEEVPGITTVENHVNVFPAAARSVFWAE
jgi:CBS domain-containing protein